MTSTIDQTGRPDGHPGYCACPTCFHLPKLSGPARPATGEASRPALSPQTRPAASEAPDELGHLRDQVRRIHGWVLFLGIVCIMQITCAVAFGIYVGVQSARQHDRATAYTACIDNGNTPLYCIANS